MTLIAIDDGQVQVNDDKLIANDGFFPDIDINVMREHMRIDSTITDSRLIDATTNAIIDVNAQLRSLKTNAIANNQSNLEELPAGQIGGRSVLTVQYLRAVYCTAKADLIERYKDYDTTASSLDDKKLVDFLSSGPDESRRNARWAISDLLGIGRVTIELI